MPSRQIFRAAALERLASPEQLDQLVQVISPQGWLALLGVYILLVGVVVWGLWGNLPDQVTGEGLLMVDGGIARVTASEVGKVLKLHVQVGDLVSRNQLIAEITPPDIDDQLKKAQLALDAMLSQKDIWSPSAILQQRLEVQVLADNRQFPTQIKSAIDGRALEIMANVGQVVEIGDPILSLDTGGELTATLYFPEKARNIQIGAEVQIEPATVNQEEFGALLGVVKRISGFVVTEHGMMRALENELLVRRLSASSTPIEVQVELVRDKRTVSGYKWTSAKGASVELRNGTLCASTVTLRDRPPISLVIPALRAWMKR